MSTEVGHIHFKLKVYGLCWTLSSYKCVYVEYIFIFIKEEKSQSRFWGFGILCVVHAKEPSKRRGSWFD